MKHNRLFPPEKKPSRLKYWIKSAMVGFTLCCLAAIFLILLIDFAFDQNAKGKIYTDIEHLPSKPIALVLGTSKYIGKKLNPYYRYRIEAAIELSNHQKVQGYLLSGDNAHRSYNEPWTMKRDLLKASIAEERIFLDYAGFRTLDSIVRAKEIFDVTEMVIITQTFHCQRALYLADFHGINAVCLGVDSPRTRNWVRFREIFARTKAVLDLYITHTGPRYLGPKEPIIDRLLELKEGK